MSVFISENKEGKEELIVTCNCGCHDALHICIDEPEPKDEYDIYAMMSYMNGNWYRDQDYSIIRVIEKKLKKIWAIIRNKDFYYSDVLMTKEDFEQFKKYINQF